MARVRKPQPTQESVIFVTPEQKVLRLLISQPTTSFNLRAISSKLKGVRGLGGLEGINRILVMLETLGMVNFVDNRRAARIQDDNSTVQIVKVLSSICELEGLKALLEPVSSKGILYGSRSTGRARSDSNYDLCIVSDQLEEIRKIASRHPMAKELALTVCTADEFAETERKDPELAAKLSRGVVLWGSTW